jgi:transposase
MMKVFKYGARPAEKEGKIREQMRLGRNYYNKLVEAENERRKMIWGDEKPPVAPHPPVEDEEGRKKACSCKECKAFWKEMRAGYYLADAKIGPVDKRPLRAKAAEGGLYWGTYLMVERAFDAARVKRKWNYPVKFRGWREGGYMGVQVQSRVKEESMVLVEKAPDPRTGRKAGQRHTVKVRVGKSWSEPVAIEMHRPLQGKITWVQVHLRYRGEKEEWAVNFTCKDTPERTDNAFTGVVAIDVGWRIMPGEEIRQAFATGDNGNEYEYSMPEKWRELSARADRIRGYRDEMLNIIQQRFPVLKKHKKPRAAREHVIRDGLDSDIELKGWVRWDKHKEDYELGCRRRSVAARRDALRVWLRMLRRRYSHAVIKDSAHKEMKDHEKAMKNGMSQRSRRNAHHGAPGEIIAEVCKVFGREEGVSVVEAPGTTATCLKCDHENVVGPERIMECEQCGAREDRDRVSTRNLLRRYFAGGTKKPTARKTKAKFTKRHNIKKQQEQCLRDSL